MGIKGEEGWGWPPGIGSMVYGGNPNDYDDDDDTTSDDDDGDDDDDDEDDDAYGGDDDDDDVDDTRPLRIVRVNETYVRIIPT